MLHHRFYINQKKDFESPALVFATNWNVSTKGSFSASVTTGNNQLARWRLPDGTVITSNAIDTNIGGFNGTTQTVQVEGDIIGVSLDNTGLQGVIDLSNIEISQNVSLRSNSNLSNVNHSNKNNVVVQYLANNSGFIGLIDFSTISIQGGLNISAKGGESIQIVHSNNNLLSGIYKCVRADSINFGNIGLDGSNTFDLRGNLFSVDAANGVFSQLNANTTNTNCIVDFTNNPNKPTGEEFNSDIEQLTIKGATILLDP